MVASRYPALVPFVTFFRQAPNVDTIELLATANAFLLFNEGAHVGTKIYDYLALRRRILFCFSDDSDTRKGQRKFYKLDETGLMNRRIQEEMIKRTESGVIIRDKEHLAAILSELYREFQETSRISCNSVGIEAFSRVSHAQKMAEIVRGVCRRRKT